MTPAEIKYVEKLKEINRLLRGPMYYEVWTKILLLETELDGLGKQCQFEMLCDPDIYEASANEHFEKQEDSKDRLIDACLALLYILKNGFHLSNPNQYFGMKCELEVEIEKLKKDLGL